MHAALLASGAGAIHPERVDAPAPMLRLRPRLLSATGALVLVGLATPAAWAIPTRVLVAWDAGVLVYLALAIVMMVRSDVEAVRRRAVAEDEGALALLVLTVLASLASVGAILAELAVHEPRSSGLQVALVGATIVLSWAFVHTLFAIHYAHEYQLGCAAAPDAPPPLAGGLDFQDPEAPDYADFVYFAFTIGVAAQTADVVITRKRLRRVVTVHAIVSFFFNAIVLALSINLVAGLF